LQSSTIDDDEDNDDNDNDAVAWFIMQSLKLWGPLE
jgi:hypothetical protein